MEPEDPTTADVHAELAALTADFFRAVSFRQGERPGYSSLHALFIADGMLIKNSSEVPEVSTVDEFIKPRQQMVDSGELSSFEEVESAAITEVFGNVAHRLSAYEKRGTSNGQAFEGRGVISTQFIRTPQGWKMTSMAWDDERPGLTIPDRYRSG
jgi:hypothetical protein